MPRKSAASLALMPLVPDDGRRQRLKPPHDLVGKGRELWIALVAACPPEHFIESDAPLLRQYVCMIDLAEHAAGALQASGPITDDGQRWFSVHQRAVRSMAVLAMRLRLTPAARSTARDSGRRAASMGPVSYYEKMRLQQNHGD
jgi:hypothetical protein